MKLPTRKRQTKAPTALPKEFLNTVGDLFRKQFKSQLKGSTFVIYADLYPSESVLCVSLSHPKSLQSASLHISADVAKEAGEKPEKVTEQLKSMVDVAASWFAQSLEGGGGLESVLEQMTDLDPGWQELEWEKATLFVKINRNNYTLERAADDFLKKAGFEDDDEAEAQDILDEIMDSDDDSSGGRGPMQ